MDKNGGDSGNEKKIVVPEPPKVSTGSKDIFDRMKPPSGKSVAEQPKAVKLGEKRVSKP